MIDYRKKRLISRHMMAKKLNISIALLTMLEEDDRCVTHPQIVDRIAAAYKLSNKQATMMLPENYRPGPDYNPDRYKIVQDFWST
jgi:hypothetical protein